MKQFLFNLLYDIHMIRPEKGIYHYRVYPFIVSFKSVKRLIDWAMELYHEWYDFDLLLNWRDSGWRVRSRNVWNSYFDYGLGCVVDGMAPIRAKEKAGYVKMSFSEAERNSKFYKERAKKELREKRKKYLREALHEVKQGRSFAREIVEQAREDDKIRARHRQEYGQI